MANTKANRIYSSTVFLPFLACLLISCSLWLLLQTIKTDVFELKISVDLENVPKNVKVLGSLPRQIAVKQSTTGTNFLYYKLFQPSHFRFEFSTSQIKSIGGGKKALLIHELLKSNKFFHNSISSVVSVDPDTIYIETGKMTNKRVPVKVKLNAIFAEGSFAINQAIINPQRVTLKGKWDLLKEVDTLVLPVSYSKIIDQDLKLKVGLPNTGKYSLMEMEPSEINFFVDVEKFTEKKVEIKINPVNVPAGKRVKLLPDKVVLTTSVPMMRYEEVNGDIFEVVADFSKPLYQNKVRLSLLKIPDYCKNQHLEFDWVEYIIIR